MAAYSPAVSHCGVIYISGQLPRLGDRVVVTGAVGTEVSLEEARHGARLALLRSLKVLQDDLGSLDRIVRILKLNVYVQSAPEFTEQSAVADAASNLICELFEERGPHARTAVGVAKLPKNASIELDLIAAINPAVIGQGS
jgi:enamine deaminase RidA (YjgF/YER057c/UK114 family)